MKTLFKIASVVSVGAFSTFGPALANDVTMFNQVPSVEELRSALKGSGPFGRTRGIVINADPAAGAAGPVGATATAAKSTVPAPKEARGNAVSLPISFGFDSAEILPPSRPYLDQVAAMMAQDRALELRVEGHTDGSGEASYNKGLSLQRAQAVIQYLATSHGIPAGRFKAVGMGESAPLADTTPDDPRNRRVQLYELARRS